MLQHLTLYEKTLWKENLTICQQKIVQLCNIFQYKNKCSLYYDNMYI